MTRRRLGLHAASACMVWMSMASIASDAGYPVSVVARDAACHASTRAAAAAGIMVAAGMGRRVEYGGAVFRHGAHCFVYSAPVTSHQPNRVEYIVRIQRGRMLLVGIYHTHTPGGHASKFSVRDREEQKRLRVPSYVGEIHAGSAEVTIRALGEAADGLLHVSTAQ
jgi:hypothetical protein